MMRGLEEAVRQGVPVEQADAAMGAAAGFPRTGIFGLFDRVGIDLMLQTASTIDSVAGAACGRPAPQARPGKNAGAAWPHDRTGL